MICLIPARAGSKRIPGKNTKLLAGQPLIAYTIQIAKDFGLFDSVIVSTDDDELCQWLWDNRGGGKTYRREVDSDDDQADIVWVREALRVRTRAGGRPESFCILRPTSPFRSVRTLEIAWRLFHSPDQTADSIRAVERVTQHPGKMWTWQGMGYPMKPLLDKIKDDGTPWHSSPTQSLPEYYVQNASLEMAWTRNVEVYGTIAGRKVAPYFTEGYEGFDLNEPRDWREAEHLIACGAAVLPEIPVARVRQAPPEIIQTYTGWPLARGSRF